jgi:hypothetical protein
VKEKRKRRERENRNRKREEIEKRKRIEKERRKKWKRDEKEKRIRKEKEKKNTKEDKIILILNQRIYWNICLTNQWDLRVSLFNTTWRITYSHLKVYQTSWLSHSKKIQPLSPLTSTIWRVCAGDECPRTALTVHMMHRSNPLCSRSLSVHLYLSLCLISIQIR